MNKTITPLGSQTAKLLNDLVEADADFIEPVPLITKKLTVPSELKTIINDYKYNVDTADKIKEDLSDKIAELKYKNDQLTTKNMKLTEKLADKKDRLTPQDPKEKDLLIKNNDDLLTGYQDLSDKIYQNILFGQYLDHISKYKDQDLDEYSVPIKHLKAIGDFEITRSPPSVRGSDIVFTKKDMHKIKKEIKHYIKKIIKKLNRGEHSDCQKEVDDLRSQIRKLQEMKAISGVSEISKTLSVVDNANKQGDIVAEIVSALKKERDQDRSIISGLSSVANTDQSKFNEITQMIKGLQERQDLTRKETMDQIREYSQKIKDIDIYREETRKLISDMQRQLDLNRQDLLRPGYHNLNNNSSNNNINLPYQLQSAPYQQVMPYPVLPQYQPCQGNNDLILSTLLNNVLSKCNGTNCNNNNDNKSLSEQIREVITSLKDPKDSQLDQMKDNLTKEIDKYINNHSLLEGLLKSKIGLDTKGKAEKMEDIKSSLRSLKNQIPFANDSDLEEIRSKVYILVGGGELSRSDKVVNTDKLQDEKDREIERLKGQIERDLIKSKEQLSKLESEKSDNIKKLEEQLKQLKQNSDCTDKIISLQKDIAELNEQIKTLKADRDDLKAQKDKLEESKKKECEDQIDKLKTELNAQISEIRKELNECTEEKASLNTKISELQRELEESLKQRDKSILEILSQINAFECDSKDYKQICNELSSESKSICESIITRFEKCCEEKDRTKPKTVKDRILDYGCNLYAEYSSNGYTLISIKNSKITALAGMEVDSGLDLKVNEGDIIISTDFGVPDLPASKNTKYLGEVTSVRGQTLNIKYLCNYKKGANMTEPYIIQKGSVTGIIRDLK
jgi:hypothetical protein